jgi:hypothetical protein
MKTPSSQIDRQLRKIACDQVILHAAKIYAANLDPSIDYGSFIVIGADKCLCLPDEQTPVLPKQRLEYQKREWMNWASSSSDLTLHGYIRWLMLPSPDDHEDCVTLEQVYGVLEGYHI